MSTMTRGPLPARVYWTRRMLVLGTAFLLVFGLARLLTGGSDATSGAEEQAVRAAATPTPTPSTPTVTQTVGPGREQTRKQEKQAQEPVLADPEGTCVDQDIAVEPKPRRPYAGQEVTIVLRLRTLESEACTWEVSPESVSVKITSGKDDIWSSRECPRSIPTEEVVVRDNVNTVVEVTWHGRRSDEECSRLTQWALPGYYHVTAAALAGEPADVQFELERPQRPHVTKTVQPKPEDKDRKKSGKSRR